LWNFIILYRAGASRPHKIWNYISKISVRYNNGRLKPTHLCGYFIGKIHLFCCSEIKLYYLFRMDSYSEGDRLRDNSMEWSNSCDFNCGTSLYCTVFCFWLRNIQWNKLWFSGTWLYISLCNKYKFFMSFSFKREKERKVILSLHFTFIIM
jgi:hypothetical protein